MTANPNSQTRATNEITMRHANRPSIGMGLCRAQNIPAIRGKRSVKTADTNLRCRSPPPLFFLLFFCCQKRGPPFLLLFCFFCTLCLSVSVSPSLAFVESTETTIMMLRTIPFMVSCYMVYTIPDCFGSSSYDQILLLFRVRCSCLVCDTQYRSPTQDLSRGVSFLRAGQATSRFSHM